MSDADEARCRQFGTLRHRLLDRAIDRGDESFNMSGGEQLRDYLPVAEVAARLVTLVEHSDLSGTINICSGTPISVRRLVENRIAERNANITLNLGHYPYPDYEPMEFWGNPSKFLTHLSQLCTAEKEISNESKNKASD